jgi:DNA-binding LacI/PurR family transcriptional regulator
MAKPRRPGPLRRLDRPQSLLQRTEQILRDAIASGAFGGNRLPSAAELAEQLGVSRETVRLAQENLQREGLLVKYRRKGTLIQPPAMTLRKGAARSTLLGFLQTDYPSGNRRSDDATRATSGLMLQGALKEAGRAGHQLVVRHASAGEMDAAIDGILREAPLRGVIFCSFGEDKMVRRVLGAGLPVVMLDHELNLPSVSTVREDARQGAALSVSHLARLRHRRIAYAHWGWADVNPWRLAGYRQGLGEARLPRRRAWELLTEITPEGADTLVEQFLKLQPRPSALLCFNTTLAALVIDRFRRHGVRVPEDVSVFGIGGEEVEGLACVQADWFGMGGVAVRTLLRAAAKGGATPEHRLFPYQLRPGRTAAPPAQGPG